MSTKKVADRDEPMEVTRYLESLSEEDRTCLDELRKIILQVVPEASQRVSYGIPIFRYKKDLVGISSQKSHCSLHTMSPDLMKRLKGELKGWKVSGATIQFDRHNLLSEELVKMILKERIKEMKL